LDTLILISKIPYSGNLVRESKHNKKGRKE
jgi:hypothetical protein